MSKKKVLIIGAGISGLYLGYELKKIGFSIKILEANNRIGGRIYTKNVHNTKVELGATWLWKYNTELLKLCKKLNIALFEQKMSGDALYEADTNNSPHRFQIPQNQEKSYRIVGGTSTILKKLRENISEEELFLNEKVIRISDEKTILKIKTENAKFEADLVISTIPPQLLVNSVTFLPELDEKIIKVANNTYTWMKDSIKFAIIYKKPFWSEKKLSGACFSNVGPFTEIYDHSNFENNHFALMGFLNSNLTSTSKKFKEKKVQQQLFKFFGEDGKNYLSYKEKVWTNERLLQFKNDTFIQPHFNNGNPIYQQSFLNNRFIVAGSETSANFGGYMEGAIYRGNEIVTILKKKLL